MNRSRITAICILMLCGTVLQGQSLNVKDVQGNLPSCSRSDSLSLVFPGDSLSRETLYLKIDSLLTGSRANVNIWHIGGSHVQGGHFTYRLQENFCSSATGMQGERGFLFPCRLAHTNSDKSFRTSATGEWTAPMMTKKSAPDKPRYGITGFGATTADTTASIGLGLGINSDTLWRFDRLRILGYPHGEDAWPYLVDGADTILFSREEEKGAYLFELPRETDSVLVRFHLPDSSSFTFSGFQPISGRGGFSYHCSGVNGAKLTNWLDEAPDLERDLALVKPDLAIFGLSINDSACSAEDFDAEKFKDNYRRLVALVRRVSPDCAFLWLTSNDSYRYVRRGMAYNENGRTVQKAMMELAQETGGAVWDIFAIMGGPRSVMEWRDAGLIKKDRLHFTIEGYIMMGDLLYNAIATDFNEWEGNR